VLVHDRTEGLPAGLARYAEGRLARLSRHFDRITEVEVEFENESRRGSSPFCSARVTVHTDGRRLPVISANETAGDARGALDLVLDKIDRQVVKLKEKIKVERKRAAAGTDASAVSEPVELAPPVERLRVKLHPQSVDEAEAALAAGRNPCYVFLDEASGQLGVCFRRPDGGLTIIEPVVT
jgi:putative sigma-54 modulation protein